MLESQQPRTWAARIDTDPPIEPQWVRQLQEVFAATGTIWPRPHPLAVGLEIGGEMAANAVQPLVQRVAKILKDKLVEVRLV